MLNKLFFTSLLLLTVAFNSAQAQAPMMGEIKMFAGTYAPRGWALCEGQMLPINSNQALFSILGTTYGGDGRTTFALPDLRNRAAVGAGSAQGVNTRRLGNKDNILTNATANTVSPQNPQVLVVNYIICLVGDYPQRN